MRQCGSVIVIPVLNPDENLKGYIETLIEKGIQKIIVVDDGSGPEYKSIFERIEEIPECVVYVHEINRGKGKAIKDGLKLYQERRYFEKYNGVITVDADGQHLVSDVLKISEAMNDTRDQLILGEREFDKRIPIRSRFGNSCTRVIFRLLYGKGIDDTQTGLRGIPNQLIPLFDEIEGDRYEYELNMLIMCRIEKIKILSIRIETIYLDNNASSHFNVVKDSFRIYKLLFRSFFKFVLSSLSSSIIDIALFHLLVTLLKKRRDNYILLATVGARICSSLYNFYVNKKLIFKNKSNTGNIILKYYGLCLVQMSISSVAVTGIYKAVSINETVIKIVVDTILFFASYRIQQSFVFGKKGD